MMSQETTGTQVNLGWLKPLLMVLLVILLVSETATGTMAAASTGGMNPPGTGPGLPAAQERSRSVGHPETNPSTFTTLRTGTYNVDANVGGTVYHSTWDIRVQNGQVTGVSHWSCCPGPRQDPLRGTVTASSIRIQRDCSGQRWNGGCIQTYTGTRKGNRIEGTATGTGLTGLHTTWVLYLNSWRAK